MSQNQTILDHLKGHRSISHKTAYERYGVARLAARIKDLREEGHQIDTITCQEYSAKQRKLVKFARYRLVQEA